MRPFTRLCQVTVELPEGGRRVLTLGKPLRLGAVPGARKNLTLDTLARPSPSVRYLTDGYYETMRAHLLQALLTTSPGKRGTNCGREAFSRRVEREG